MTRLVSGSLLLALIGCSDDPQSGPTPPPPPPPAGSVTVDVQDNLFTPAARAIQVGQTVQWVWRGGNPHNVTFTGGPTSTTQTNGTFQRTFSTAGQFSYLCTVHGQSMSGVITVTP